MSDIVIDKRKRHINIKKSNLLRLPSNYYNEIKIDKKEIRRLLGKRVCMRDIFNDHSLDFPKYVYPSVNQAGLLSRSCSSKNIGHLHSLIKKRKFRSLSEWKIWYTKKNPNNVKIAVDKLYDCLIELMSNITNNNTKVSKKGQNKLKEYCQVFVENLMFEKTFAGLKIQEVILAKLSEIVGEQYVWTNEKDDSSGVDGYIGKIPVSVKPKSCKYAKKPGVKRIIYTIDKDQISFVHSI